MVDLVLFIFAFSAGLVSFINPCGFAVLPSFISNYFSKERKSNNFLKNLSRGIFIGFITFAGFITFFVLIGVALSFVSRTIANYIPTVNFLFGFLILSLGILTLFKKNISLHLPILSFNPNSSSSFYQYGIIYSLVSFGCTMPLFLSVVFSSAFASSLLDSFILLLSYSLGMGILMIAVTTAIATSREILFSRINWIMTKIRKINALLLIFLGLYLVVYIPLRVGLFFPL